MDEQTAKSSQTEEGVVSLCEDGTMLRSPKDCCNLDVCYCAELQKVNVYEPRMDLDDLREIQRSWQPPLEATKKTRSFYEQQDSFIDSLAEASKFTDGTGVHEITSITSKVALAAKITFCMNLCLMGAKAAAAALSGSLSIISSVVDSGVDLVSGFVIWYTSRAIRRTDIYQYPIGRTRLEPIGIVIVSLIMAMASVLVIRESIERIVHKSGGLDVSPAPMAIIGATILIKLILFFYCRAIKSVSTKVLALDHRNDVMLNSVVLVCSIIGDRYWFYIDPIGGILISLYIFFNWWKTGNEQIRRLAGQTAPPEFMRMVTWVCLQHCSTIMKIDTVRAFRIGTNYLVEVDIVLPEHMPLRNAHDIGESLQQKLEALPDVERAFVHLDYECAHHPSVEHKMTVIHKGKRPSTTVPNPNAESAVAQTIQAPS